MSLFGNISINEKQLDKEKDFYDEMEKRGDGMFKITSNFNETKEESFANEIHMNRNDRENERYKHQTLRNNIKFDHGKSLSDCLSIDKTKYDEVNSIVANPLDMDVYIRLMASDNALEQYYGLVGIRKLLTLDENPLIQEVIDKSIVFPLVTLLDSNIPEFLHEAVICLCAISSGNSDQIKSITSKGAQKKMIFLADSQIIEIQEQAIWCLGNIASDNIALRESLINDGALDKLLYYLKTSSRKSLVKNCLWALSNFCKGKTAPKWESISPFLDYIIQVMIKYVDDSDIIVDCVWVLGFFSDNFMRKTIQYLSNLSVLPHIVKVMKYFFNLVMTTHQLFYHV